MDSMVMMVRSVRWAMCECLDGFNVRDFGDAELLGDWFVHWAEGREGLVWHEMVLVVGGFSEFLDGRGEAGCLHVDSSSTHRHASTQRCSSAFAPPCPPSHRFPPHDPTCAVSTSRHGRGRHFGSCIHSARIRTSN
jgi:hypothetical protein